MSRAVKCVVDSPRGITTLFAKSTQKLPSPSQPPSAPRVPMTNMCHHSDRLTLKHGSPVGALPPVALLAPRPQGAGSPSGSSFPSSVLHLSSRELKAFCKPNTVSECCQLEHHGLQLPWLGRRAFPCSCISHCPCPPPLPSPQLHCQHATGASGLQTDPATHEKWRHCAPVFS